MPEVKLYYENITFLSLAPLHSAEFEESAELTVVSECNEESRPSGHEMFHSVQHDKEKVKITFGTTLY